MLVDNTGTYDTAWSRKNEFGIQCSCSRKEPLRDKSDVYIQRVTGTIRPAACDICCGRQNTYELLGVPRCPLLITTIILSQMNVMQNTIFCYFKCFIMFYHLIFGMSLGLHILYLTRTRSFSMAEPPYSVGHQQLLTV